MFKLPVERPITVTMFFLAVALFGTISLLRIPQELFPSFEYPQIAVITRYEGAGPEEAEKLITKLIEETVKTTKNIRRVWSISKEGNSIVVCEFFWGTDINFAALEVREKLDLIKERLPKDCKEPIVLKYNPFQIEVINLSVRYKTVDTDLLKLAELRMLCKKNIKDELEKLEGVAKVDLYGGTEKEILIDVDKNRLIANNLSLLDVIKAIKETNITYPAGTIKEEKQEFNVKTIGEFQTIDDIRNLIIPVEKTPQLEQQGKQVRIKSKEGKSVVYISDIAEVKESIKDIRGYSRYNRKEHISVAIYPQSRTNLIKLSTNVRKKLKEIISTKLPNNVEVEIVYDQANFIKESLNNIYLSAIQGGVLAFIILFIFLKNIMASIIICISIPLAILATLCFMYFYGISLNTMSLGGLALGVGMLVDNSIIVLEKIFLEKVKNPYISNKEIIYSSTIHVVGDVISSTLTTIAIFLPLVFVGGVLGKLFKELALTVSFSLLSSILVALFLVPRLSLWIDLERYSTENYIKKMKKDIVSEFLSLFPPLLKKVLNLPLIVIFRILSLYFLIGFLLVYFIPKKFMPKIDERKILVNIILPSSFTVENTNKIVSEIEKFVNSSKYVKNILVNIGSAGEEKSGTIESLGPNQARLIINLKNKGISTDKFVSLIVERMKELPVNVEAEFITQQGFFGTGIGSGSDIIIEIKGKELEKIKRIADKIALYLKKMKNVYGIKIVPGESTKEVRFEICRDRSSLFGITVQDIAATILAGIKGYVATKFKYKEDEFDVRVRFQERYRTNIDEIGGLTIYAPFLDKHIRLDQISETKITDSPPEIRRIGGERTYLVYANTKKDFNKVISNLRKYIRKIQKQEFDIKIDITGEMLSLKESISSSIFAFILAVIVIYMILASQFESLVQPLIVMVTIPLGVIGAVYSLFLTFNSLNAVSMLGFIMLIGIVVNNGIVLVSEYNFMLKKFPKKDLLDVVIEVTCERLRPILMTTLTTILGLLPMAIGIPSRTVNSSMAIAILGGLSFALFLTLFFVPVAYLLVNRKNL